jgi:hypothetical protein
MNEAKLTDPFIGIVYQLVNEELRNQQDTLVDLYNLSPNNVTKEDLIKLGELCFLKNYLTHSIK